MRRPKFLAKSKRLPLLLGVLVVVLIVGLALAFGNHGQSSTTITPTSVSPSNQPTASGTPTPTPDTKVHAGPNTDSSTPRPTATPVDPNRPAAPAGTLAKPTGPQLSRQEVSLKSNDTTIEAVCQAASGTNCYIQATKGAQVIKVSDTKTISDNTYPASAAVFDWNAKQLSAGAWTIQAVASASGQTAASDPQTLTVNP